jgi:hypothetical protein
MEATINDTTIGWGFKIVVPVEMPAGSTYAEAQRVYTEMQARVNAFLDTLGNEAPIGTVYNCEFELAD